MVTKSTRPKKSPSPKRPPIPRNTDWVPIVAGGRVPANILLWLWQETDDGRCLAIGGVFHRELEVFVDQDGGAIELDGRVTHYHVMVTPHGNVVELFEEDDDK